MFFLLYWLLIFVLMAGTFDSWLWNSFEQSERWRVVVIEIAWDLQCLIHRICCMSEWSSFGNSPCVLTSTKKCRNTCVWILASPRFYFHRRDTYDFHRRDTYDIAIISGQWPVLLNKLFSVVIFADMTVVYSHIFCGNTVVRLSISVSFKLGRNGLAFNW